MFIDRVNLTLTAGKGGNGIVAWRREKYIPKGGPYGGNGGPGGSIILEADKNCFSLEYYHNRRMIKAQNGGAGGPNRKQGKKGEHLILKVPIGTIIKDRQSGQILGDLTEDGEQLTLCEGGKGGLGNYFFKSATNQAPNYSTPGKEGQTVEVELELKILADIGLVGMPNAGKSTLISKLTTARVKIAPYPFTTTSPNLGFIEFDDYSRILIADIPGIISGAHLDKGLGISFLRHIERTKMLIFLLDASGIDGRHPVDDFDSLQFEIKAYSPLLLERPCIIVLNKIDEPEAHKHCLDFHDRHGKSFLIFETSALEKQGLAELKEKIYELSRSYARF